LYASEKVDRTIQRIVKEHAIDFVVADMIRTARYAARLSYRGCSTMKICCPNATRYGRAARWAMRTFAARSATRWTFRRILER
jgi:hypothetical protein